MTIKQKLNVFLWVTITGLAGLLFATISGLNAIHEAEMAAQRRESYSLLLVEIKASAVSTIMLDPTIKETREIFSDAEKRIADFESRILQVIRRPEIREEFKQIISQWSRYDNSSQQLIKLALTDVRTANESLLPLYTKQFKPFQRALEKFVAERLADADLAREDANKISTKVYWTIIPLAAVIATVNVVLLLILSASLRKRLTGILDKLEYLRQGNLTERLPVEGSDELSQIAASVNNFATEVQNIVLSVLDSSQQVSSAASQLARTAGQVATSSASQSDAAASTAAAIEEMSVSVSSIAETTSDVRLLSNTSLEDAIKGDQSILELQQELAKVQADVDAIATHVREFVCSTNSIADMTQQIREIADQTNLLALNAAIEAARAGEQGRGFAVVADEVRKLAERASGSAGEITTVTEDLNSKSNLVNQSVEDGLASLAASLEFIGNLSDTLARTSRSVKNTSTGVEDVTASVREQKTASAEIARNVEKIAQMAETNRVISQESAEASGRIEHLALILKNKVAHFKA